MDNFLKISSQPNRSSPAVIVGIFICLGFLLYLKTFSHTWTFDDYYVIVNNADFRSLENFFRDQYPGRPLRELSFMLDFMLFGDVPVFWHFQNFIIHSLNAALIFILLDRLFKDRIVAWLTALLFLVHPINVEVVAQTSHRKDSLCLLFLLLSFLAYQRAREQVSMIRVCVFLLLFVLALMAKEAAIAFPLFLFFYELICLDPDERLFLRSNRIAFLVGIVGVVCCTAALLTIDFSSKMNYLLKANNITQYENVFGYYSHVIYALGFILTKLIVPDGLSVNYLFNLRDNLLNNFSGLLLIYAMVISMIAFGLYHRDKKSLVPIIWFIVFLLPTSNLIPVTNHLTADRYMYIPLFGIFAACLLWLRHKSRTVLFLPVMVALVICFSTLTFQQIDVWRDNGSLWEHALKHNPDSSTAIANVARMNYKEDQETFISMHEKAIRIHPENPYPYYSLASYYDSYGQMKPALHFYRLYVEKFDAKYPGMYLVFYQNAKTRIQVLSALANNEI